MLAYFFKFPFFFFFRMFLEVFSLLYTIRPLFFLFTSYWAFSKSEHNAVLVYLHILLILHGELQGNMRLIKKPPTFPSTHYIWLLYFYKIKFSFKYVPFGTTFLTIEIQFVVFSMCICYSIFCGCETPFVYNLHTLFF